MCPYFDPIACIFNLNRSNGLERNQDLLLLTVCMPYRSKNGCFVQGNDLSNYLQLDIN